VCTYGGALSHVKIKTFIDPDFQVYVPAFIFNINLGRRFYPILFLVDTGATVTTILDGDAERLNIDFSKLKLAETKALGVGGFRDTYEMHDTIIALEEEGTGELIYERLEKIDILKPEKESVKLPFSLLGTDFLKRFEFKYRMPILEL
jgi:hypothetical protein